MEKGTFNSQNEIEESSVNGGKNNYLSDEERGNINNYLQAMMLLEQIAGKDINNVTKLPEKLGGHTIIRKGPELDQAIKEGKSFFEVTYPESTERFFVSKEK